MVTAVRFLNGRKFLFIDCSDSKHACPAPLITRRRLPRFPSETATRHHQNPWDICVCENQDASRSEIFFKRRHNRLRRNPRQLPALRAEVAAAAALATPALYPAFFFVLEKAVKSAGNAVIPTFPTHWSHGLQHLRHKRRNVRFEGLRRVHTCLRQQDRTQRHTRRNRGVSDGALSLPSERFTRFGNPAWPGVRTANFAAFGSWPGVLPKNAESLRDSDALMRVTVPRRRGPAGLRDLFRFCRNCGLYALRSGPFRVCEARGGIATLSALYVLLKHRTAACQNGSFAVF